MGSLVVVLGAPGESLLDRLWDCILSWWVQWLVLVTGAFPLYEYDYTLGKQGRGWLLSGRVRSGSMFSRRGAVEIFGRREEQACSESGGLGSVQCSEADGGGGGGGLEI